MKKRKESIFNALIAEVIKESYAKASITNICEAVPCSRQNFYYYYDTLNDAIIDMIHIDLKSIKSFDSSANALKAVLSVISMHFAFYKELFRCPESYYMIGNILIDILVDLYSSFIPYFAPETAKIESKVITSLYYQLAFADLALIETWINKYEQEPIESILSLSITANKNQLSSIITSFLYSVTK